MITLYNVLFCNGMEEGSPVLHASVSASTWTEAVRKAREEAAKHTEYPYLIEVSVRNPYLDRI